MQWVDSKMKLRPAPVFATVTMNFLYCNNRVKYKGPFPRSLDIFIDLAGNYNNHNTGQVFHVIVFTRFIPSIFFST